MKDTMNSGPGMGTPEAFNEKKKALYKEKPVAKRVPCNCKDVVKYEATTSTGKVLFRVPLDEAASFEETMPAQLLIRWLQQEDA